MTKDEKRLRKRMNKLYRWARKHGYGWVDICVMGPDNTCAHWYANGALSATIYSAPSARATKFYEGSDDE